MSTKLGKIIADFRTSLATKLSVGASTCTLQSATDDDGNALPSGIYFFTIDGDNSQKEHIVATLSGTSLSSISSVSRQGVQTANAVREHRIGASVVITNFAHIKYINDLLDGTTDLNASVPLKYDGTATISNANHLATKAYVDGVAIAGGADASTTVKGISKLSVAPVSGTNPIAVGQNDPKVPTVDVSSVTSGMVSALAANNGTPGSGNKYISQTGYQIGAEIYAADSVGTDAYAITLSPVPSAYVTGMKFRFKAGTANTGAATLNVNSLGAKTIKRNSDQDLQTGDIKVGQIVEVTYDGTNFQMQSQLASTSVTISNVQQLPLPFNVENINSTTFGIAANTVYTFPIYIPNRITVTKMVYKVSSGSDGARKLGFGIYSSDGNTRLITTGALTPASNVILTTTLGTPVTLDVGTYILAWCVNDSNLVYGAIAGSAGLQEMTNNITVRYGTAANASSGGVLPSTLGAITTAANNIISIILSTE